MKICKVDLFFMPNKIIKPDLLTIDLAVSI